MRVQLEFRDPSSTCMYNNFFDKPHIPPNSSGYSTLVSCTLHIPAPVQTASPPNLSNYSAVVFCNSSRTYYGDKPYKSPNLYSIVQQYHITPNLYTLTRGLKVTPHKWDYSTLHVVKEIYRCRLETQTCFEYIIISVEIYFSRPIFESFAIGIYVLPLTDTNKILNFYLK